MSLVAIGLGLLSVGAAGTFAYALYQGHQKMTRLLDMQTLLRESQATHFHHLNLATEGVLSDVRSLQTTLGALRTIHPDIDASLSVHDFLIRHEGKEHADMSIQEACDVLRLVVQHQPVEGGSSTGLSVNHAGLLRRLLTLFDARHLTMTALHVDADTAHRLGLAAAHLQMYDWAEGALGVAYQLSPGHASVLEGLEHIARLRGDDALLRHWMEARMKLTPDDPALLRAHAHLLASLGDEEAERAVRRLEALGVDTAADRSLLSGLRARAGARTEAIEAILQALEEDPSRSGDWLHYAQLLEAEGEHELALEANERCLTLDRQCGEAWALKAR
ncbi:MAG: hypothetical protein VXZ34_07970, partial [Candidatus Thermoplasmatota archaeon]|nr:hypothetical protein [Candidatus Thermoplasmatota archaeon]